MYDFITAYRGRDLVKLRQWVRGKAVFLGPDDKVDGRYPTPFYSFFQGSKWTTPGFEIHANTLRTILTGQFLSPVPQWVRVASLALAAGLCVAVVTSFPVSQTVFWAIAAMFIILLGTHALFRGGWILSTSEMFLCFALALMGGIIYRFATAERKSSFFKSAVALFVGKQVAQRIVAEGVKLGGAEQPHRHFPAAPEQRVGEVPTEQPALERAALQRAEVVRVGGEPAQPPQFITRAVGAAVHRALHRQNAENGAGRHSADGAHGQLVLEQAVEHSSGKGPMRTTPLQGEGNPQAAGAYGEHDSVMSPKWGI